MLPEGQSALVPDSCWPGTEWVRPRRPTGVALCDDWQVCSSVTPSMPGLISPVFPNAQEGAHTLAEPPPKLPGVLPAQLLWGQQGCVPHPLLPRGPWSAWEVQGAGSPGRRMLHNQRKSTWRCGGERGGSERIGPAITTAEPSQAGKSLSPGILTSLFTIESHLADLWLGPAAP